MTVEIKTAQIEPLRLTFDHLEARIGKGRAATRYQEAVHDMQMTTNFHYRPTWEPGMDLFDRRRTAVVLADFDQLIDPRQYYYAPYTIQRARQQDHNDANFGLVEKRHMLANLAPEWAQKIRRLIVPLRHLEWGANTNNTFLSAYGYGAPFTSAALMQAMDRLGVAQYITRLALALDGQNAEVLDRGKQIWLTDPVWQPLRHLVEDSMVLKDWFELHVLQNLLMDSQLASFAWVHFDTAIAAHGGVGFTPVTQFMRDWHAESTRWVDATVKVAVSESPANQTLINSWVGQWLPRVRAALAPVLAVAFEEQADAIAQQIRDELAERLVRLGLVGEV